MSLGRSRRGGDRELDHVDPEIKILPEGALFDALSEISVCSCQNPGVSVHCLGRSKGLVLAVVQYPEEFHLQGDVHFADLVEQQSAPVGQTELARFVPLGVGKGALFVPEELRFEQGGGQSGAVELDVGAVFAGTEVVDDLGDEFLPRSARPLNETAALRLGDVG